MNAGWLVAGANSRTISGSAEVLKPFDDVLDNEVFACEEENMFVANGIIGAVPHHPMLQHYKKLIDENFRGTGELVFQAGMYLWTELVKHSEWSKGVKLYAPEWFLPYNHQTDTLKITENTHTNHYYLKSWLKKHDTGDQEKGSEMADNLESVS